MKCPNCGSDNDRVIDSRLTCNGTVIRRRRECNNCGQRFSTAEMITSQPLFVIKKSGGRQEFDREKLRRGIWASCGKRPISAEQINHLVDDVETAIAAKPKREMSSQDIGLLVLNRLKRIDEVAYIRFASVYRDFDGIASFLTEMNNMRKK